MVYESSYEAGRAPFLPDKSRGFWSTPTDFVYACLGLAFKMEVFSMSWLFFYEMGFYGIFPYIICLFLYVVPIMVIQSFMGQFSSSGYISVFRISPIFKGVGYISLALNISVLTYYSIFAVVPLLFFFNSFRSTLPWSCEAVKTWDNKTIRISEHNTCNVTPTQNTNDSESYKNYQVPSALYFESHFGVEDPFQYTSGPFIMSWTLVFCSLIIWSVIAYILYKFFETDKFGKLLRYAITGSFGVLVVCIMRFMFLPGASDALHYYFHPSFYEIREGIPSVLIYAMSSFGAGWGNVVALSSLNRFKTDIMRYSWIICVGQMIIFMSFGMVSFLVEYHFLEITDDNYFSFVEHHWIMYMSTGSAIATMELPNLWSLLYFGMLIVTALIIMIIQLRTVLLSLFDEFEYLRLYKRETMFTLIAILASVSLYFDSNHGIISFAALSVDGLFTQTALNLLLLLIVLWIYGRVRFQRDIEFMLGKTFETWKINILRYVAPIFLLLTLLIALIIAISEHFFSSTIVHVAAVFFILLPWLFVPGYGLYNILQTTGTPQVRFKRCCRPTDWYPVEAEDRQRYEEAMGNVDITHQLHEIDGEVL